MAAQSSCEPKRSSAYSEDLRWRIVWQSEALQYKPARIAENLNIDESTVRRILNIFLNSGTVSKRPYPSEKSFRIITDAVLLFIVHLLLRKPGIYLREIVSELRETLGVDTSESAVCKALKKACFMQQKLATYVEDSLRQRFVREVSLYSKDLLIFVDETGSDSTDARRKRGYSTLSKIRSF